MNLDAFKRFFLYYVKIFVMLFIMYFLILFIFNKPKLHFIELCILFSICLMTCLTMGCVGSYLSKQLSVTYHIKDGSMTIDMISKTLNKSGYICNSDKKDQDDDEIIYSLKTRNAKFYGKVYLTIYKDNIEVKAPRILFIKYLNKLNLDLP